MPTAPITNGPAGRRLTLTGLALLIFAIAYLAPVNKPESDPRLSLLVSQAILERGAFSLEPYAAQLPEEIRLGNHRINPINDALHYAYPLGPSLAALPFVAVARRAGMDMAEPEAEAWLQNLLSALSAALIFLAAAALAGTRLPWPHAALLALLGTLGSTLISTVGTALWTMNIAALAALVALWITLRAARDNARPLDGLLLGGMLFLAFASRPTAALFIASLLLYLFFANRPLFWPAALGALLPTLLLMGAYWRELHLPLHPYYLPGSLGGIQNFAAATVTPLPRALYGLLLSPSRGLVTFSPLLLLLPAGFLGYWTTLRRRPLFWLASAWFGSHLLVVSRFTMWWGGYSFGPRLLTESLPALLLLGLLIWEAILASRPPRAVAAAWIFALGVLGGSSIGIHAGSGLFNQAADDWNASLLAPRIEQQPAYIYDWRYPQFLATPAMLCARNADFLTRAATRFPGLAPYSPAYRLAAVDYAPESWAARVPVATAAPSPAAPAPQPPGADGIYLPFAPIGGAVDALWSGFSSGYALFRPALCPQASVLIGPLASDAPAGAYALEIHAVGDGSAVGISFNGEPLQRAAFTGAAATVTIRLSEPLLSRTAVNEIGFQRLAPDSDSSAAWLAVASVRLAPASVAYGNVPTILAGTTVSSNSASVR